MLEWRIPLSCWKITQEERRIAAYFI